MKGGLILCTCIVLAASLFTPGAQAVEVRCHGEGESVKCEVCPEVGECQPCDPEKGCECDTQDGCIVVGLEIGYRNGPVAVCVGARATMDNGTPDVRYWGGPQGCEAFR